MGCSVEYLSLGSTPLRTSFREWIFQVLMVSDSGCQCPEKDTYEGFWSVRVLTNKGVEWSVTEQIIVVIATKILAPRAMLW